MNQEFYGSVAQVAGRDIINEPNDSLWHQDTWVLEDERRRCKTKLFQQYRDIYTSMPFFWLLGGALVTWYLFRIPNWFYVQQLRDLVWLALWLVVAVGVPYFWHEQLCRRKRKFIAFYRTRLSIIEMILEDRR